MWSYLNCTRSFRFASRAFVLRPQQRVKSHMAESGQPDSPRESQNPAVNTEGGNNESAKAPNDGDHDYQSLGGISCNLRQALQRKIEDSDHGRLLRKQSCAAAIQGKGIPSALGDLIVQFLPRPGRSLSRRICTGAVKGLSSVRMSAECAKNHERYHP